MKARTKALRLLRNMKRIDITPRPRIVFRDIKWALNYIYLFTTKSTQ